MRDDGDFTAYAEARWPTLVRCLVLLGSETSEAAEVAEAALARCRQDWRSIRQAGDIDVEVYAELLDVRAERARAEQGPAATPHPAPGAADPGPQPSDAALLLGALLDALDRL